MGQNVRVNWAVEGRGRWPTRVGFVEYFVLVPLAVGGLVLLYRRRIPLSPLLAMPVVITITAAFTFGITRYRMPVDVTLVILAAVAMDALLGRFRASPDGDDLVVHRGRDTPGDRDPVPAAMSTGEPVEDAVVSSETTDSTGTLTEPAPEAK